MSVDFFTSACAVAEGSPRLISCPEKTEMVLKDRTQFDLMHKLIAVSRKYYTVSNQKPVMVPNSQIKP